MSSKISTIVPLSTFKWNKRSKTLECNAFVFNPRGEAFGVQSERTGKIITFIPDYEDMASNEFYDGEMATWKPTEPCSVVRLFVTNW